MIIETNSAEETFALGKALGEKASPGQIYTLDGDLGTGKTVFTQGVAAGLGITEAISSPTFPPLYRNMIQAGFRYTILMYIVSEILKKWKKSDMTITFGEGICLIEWADLIREILPEHVIRITIEKDLEKGFDYRKITIGE